MVQTIMHSRNKIILMNYFSSGVSTKSLIVTMHSNDNGVTWTEPREITKNVKKSNWTW